MDAAGIAAIVSGFGTLGTGIAWVYSKVERRISKIEAELRQARKDVEDCRARHAGDRSFLGEVLIAVRLLADEVRIVAPASPALALTERLLKRAFPVEAATDDMVDLLRKMP